MRDGVLAAIPYPVRMLVGVLASRSVMSTLQGQGTLRYSADEIAALRLEVWEAINALLAESRSKMAAKAGAGPFWILGGQAPTESDPVVFGFITSSLTCAA